MQQHEPRLQTGTDDDALQSGFTATDCNARKPTGAASFTRVNQKG